MTLCILEAMQRKRNQKINYMALTLQMLPLQTSLKATILTKGNYTVKLRIEQTLEILYLPKGLFEFNFKRLDDVIIETNNLSDVKVIF